LMGVVRYTVNVFLLSEVESAELTVRV